MPSDFVAKPPYNVLQPGAYSAVNASLLTAPNYLFGPPIPVVLGTALGGAPDTPLYFTSPGQLQQVLRGGIGYDAARFLFDGGASRVCFVRVGNAVTQSTLVLAGASGTCITLTARDYGSWCNSIAVSVASGPIITLAYTDQFGNVFTEQWNLTAVSSPTNATIASAINGGLYGYNASNFVTAAAGSGTLPLTVVPAAPMTGGTDGLSPVSGDWTNGFSALETELVDLVVPATSDATVHAQGITHCQNMSLPQARRERFMICGGALGESVAAQITRIGNLRSARAQLVYPGFQDYNAAGVLTMYDSFYMAAKIAGMHCALPDVASSLIHQQVPIVAAEVNLSTIQGGAVDQLLQAGVSPISRAPSSGYWVVDSLTGYNQPDEVFRDVISTRSADFVSQYARQVLESKFVGGKTLPTTQNTLTADANQVMSDLVGMQVIYGNLPAVVDPGPNVNSWNVSLPVMLISTDKYIFITVALQPSSTLASSTTTQDLS